MIKKIKREGPNGVFTGIIAVADEVEHKQVHNRVTHDEEYRILPVYKVRAILGDNINGMLIESGAFNSRDSLIEGIKEIELSLIKILENKATALPEKTLEDRLKEMGFTS